MKRKIVAIVVAIITVPMVVIAVSALSFVAGGCSNSVVAEAVSPNGHYKAVTFERSCGATTGFSTQVSLLPVASELPNEAGNALVLSSGAAATPLGFWGGPAVAVTWLGPQQLQLSYHVTAQVSFAAKLLQGIVVAHKVSAQDAV
jgi:hypothetical protein